MNATHCKSLLLIAVSCFFLSACSDSSSQLLPNPTPQTLTPDTTTSVNSPSEGVVALFELSYPSAVSNTWTKVSSLYQRASFYLGSDSCTVWYNDSTGEEELAVIGVATSALPSSITDVMTNNLIPTTDIRTVDSLVQSAYPTLWLVDVTGYGESVFTKDSYMLASPGTLTDSLSTSALLYLTTTYPTACAVRCYTGYDTYSVTFLHDDLYKTMLFTSGSWSSTSWYILPSALPTAVSTAISSSPVTQDEPILLVEYFISSVGSYYRVTFGTVEQSLGVVRYSSDGEVVLD